MATPPPIYVINLKRNPERRLHIQRQLDALSLEYEFVDVDDIDKYELESKAYRTRIAQSLGIDESLLENKYAAIVNHAKTEKDKNWKNANLGQIAIILSHIKIYDLMVKNGIDWACILEDDATLLPTFPEVLKIAPKLEWDILLLASQPSGFWPLIDLVQTKPIRYLLFFRKFIKYLFSLNHRTNNSNSAKQRAYSVKRLLEVYGISPYLYPRQSERIAQIYQEYDTKFEEIMRTTIPDKLRLSWSEFRSCKKRHSELYGVLVLYTSIQLGALPEKNSLESINEYHRITEPKYCPLAATGYLVNQSTAMKWKRKALAPDILAIDQIPWRLYKNEQVRLRIVTPPCATATYDYLKYSVRRR